VGLLQDSVLKEELRSVTKRRSKQAGGGERKREMGKGKTGDRKKKRGVTSRIHGKNQVRPYFEE